MVLVAKGPSCAGNLCHGYRQVHKSLTQANMKDNLKKTSLESRPSPPPSVTTRDVGVDTKWAAWKCPMQRKRVITFQQSMNRVRWLGLPPPAKRGLSSRFSVLAFTVLKWSASHMNDVRISVRKALSKGANLNSTLQPF
eukprot:991815-Amphidinium_carterae.1